MHEIYFFIIYFVVICTNIFPSSIIEHKNINDILPYSSDDGEKIIFAFDLDNTIWASSYKYVWSDYWYNHHYLKYADCDNPLMRWYKDLYSIRFNLNLKLCDDDIPMIIKQLQRKKNCWVIGLTKRWICLVPSTLKMLSDFGISFIAGTNILSHNDLFFSHYNRPACYTHGIIFAGQNNKSSILDLFLCAIDFQPDRIILIDDSKKNLDDMEQFSTNNKISYIGIWYSPYCMDENQFDGLAADQEFNSIKHKFSYDDFPNNTHPDIQQSYLNEMNAFNLLN